MHFCHIGMRALIPSEAIGRGFESLRARHMTLVKLASVGSPPNSGRIPTIGWNSSLIYWWNGGDRPRAAASKWLTSTWLGPPVLTVPSSTIWQGVGSGQAGPPILRLGGTVTLEAMARLQVDQRLEAASWIVEDKDNNLDGHDDLPLPDGVAREIIDHLEAALTSFRDVASVQPKSGGA